jgi:hypothetical protein
MATHEWSMPAAHRVLVIEDNADGRESLMMILSLGGFAVDGAEDGAEGRLAVVVDDVLAAAGQVLVDGAHGAAKESGVADDGIVHGYFFRR